MSGGYVYEVFISHTDEEDPFYMKKVGVRKTQAGAQALAASLLGCKIYGFCERGTTWASKLEASGNGKTCVIKSVPGQ